MQRRPQSSDLVLKLAGQHKGDTCFPVSSSAVPLRLLTYTHAHAHVHTALIHNEPRNLSTTTPPSAHTDEPSLLQGLEEQHVRLVDLEEQDVLRLVGDGAPEILPDDRLPRWLVLLVKELLQSRRHVLEAQERLCQPRLLFDYHKLT
jgi:hypothetical protein